MIPNRAPAPRTNDLTMFRYQERVAPPPIPSNAEQRRVVAENAQLPPIPKKIGRPRGPVKIKCADPHRQKGITLSAGHDKRIRKQVEEVFKHGPLTVDMLQRQLKLSLYNSAGRKVFDWKKRDLIEEVDGPPVVGKNGQRCKWWDLKKPTNSDAN